jgi:mannosyltransferase OCH1-like enzyme
MYVDFDSECLEPMDELFIGKTCCFSMEPEEHGLLLFNKTLYFNNALMASVPEDPFMKKIIEQVFSYIPAQKKLFGGQRITEILTSAGPLMLVDLYEKYGHQYNIYLIPAKYVSPFTDKEVRLIMQGDESEELERKLEGAYSIHYFFNGWVQKTLRTE